MLFLADPNVNKVLQISEVEQIIVALPMSYEIVDAKFVAGFCSQFRNCLICHKNEPWKELNAFLDFFIRIETGCKSQFWRNLFAEQKLCILVRKLYLVSVV